MAHARKEDSMFAIPHYSDCTTTTSVPPLTDDDSDERCERFPSFHTSHRQRSRQHNVEVVDRRWKSTSKVDASATATTQGHHATEEGYEVVELHMEIRQMKVQMQNLQRETNRNIQIMAASTVRSTQRVNALELSMQSMYTKGDFEKVYLEMALLREQLSAERQATIAADMSAKHEQDVTFYNLYSQIRHYVGVSDPQILMDIKRQIGLKLKDLQQNMGQM